MGGVSKSRATQLESSRGRGAYIGIPDSSPATGGFPLVGDGDADVVVLLLLDMLVLTSSLPAGSLERGIVW